MASSSKNKIVPSKYRMKLIMASVVAIAAVYTYVAYSRNLFPFTVGFKNKVSGILSGSMFGGGEPPAVRSTPNCNSATNECACPNGDVFKMGAGRTCGDCTIECEERGYEPDRSYSDVPGTLSNLDLTDLYNLMFYNQRRLEGNYESDEDMLQGGDIPPEEYGYYDNDEEIGRGGEEEEDYEDEDGRPIFDPSKLGRKRRWGDRDRDELEEEEEDLPPDIPEHLPDDVLAEIGDLRDLRDRLLAEIDALEAELQAEIDLLKDKLEEEKEKREELVEVVEEIKKEIEEEQDNDDVPTEKKHKHNKDRVEVIAVAQADHDGVKAEIKQIVDEVKSTKATITAAVSKAEAIGSKIKAVAITGKVSATSKLGDKKSSFGSSSAGTKKASAEAGGGKAVACAGGKCISAGMALRVGYLSRGERQYAFSKLQHKARRMNTLKARPVSFLKNKQFLNILPPVIKRRHLSTRMTIS